MVYHLAALNSKEKNVHIIENNFLFIYQMKFDIYLSPDMLSQFCNGLLKVVKHPKKILCMIQMPKIYQPP